MTQQAVADRFLRLRDQLTHQRVGDGAREVATALTTALDDVVAELATTTVGEPVAVVAIGGYGNEALCLRSDVDLMILHDGADLEAVTGAVLYPLWDADLRIGHSVRTVEEAVDVATDSFETLTSLLSMRLLAGNGALVAHLESRVAELIRNRPFATRLADAERERRRRHPYPVMAADVKNGRGGLRTYQGFGWERRRAELLGLPPPHIADAHERRAGQDLLAVRNALHAVAGRAVDQFVVDLRSPAAQWLGVDVDELAERMCDALALGDRLAERRWGDLIPGADPMVALGRKVFGRITSRFRSDDGPTARHSPLGVALAAVQRPEGVWLSTVERERIVAAVEASDPWTPGDRKALAMLLTTGERGRAVWDLLTEVGWVQDVLPEWSVVAYRPQLAPFHEHPVGTHLWRTVDEMWAMCNGNDEYRQLADDVGSTEELLLAAFLHDIGKGSGADHALAGAEAVSRFCARTGYGPATTALLVATTRHHLLVSHTATRQDPDDPGVIDGLAALVGDLRTLKVLYLLTVADSRATGATMWTPWKAALLRRLLDRAQQVYEPEPNGSGTRFDVVVHAATQRYPLRVVEEHLEAMPKGYLLETDIDDITWHLDVLQRAGIGSSTERVVVSVHADDGLDCAVVVGPERSGLLGSVATTFAVHGASVLGARLYTRDDGAAVGVFHVANDRGGGEVPAERWEHIERDLNEVVMGRLDLSDELKRRGQAYDRRSADIATRVVVRASTSGRDTVIEVRCLDRIGRLAQIARALYAEGLDIRRATLDGRAQEVIDTFHVLAHDRTLDEERWGRLEERLAMALRDG